MVIFATFVNIGCIFSVFISAFCYYLKTSGNTENIMLISNIFVVLLIICQIIYPTVSLLIFCIVSSFYNEPHTANKVVLCLQLPVTHVIIK